MVMLLFLWIRNAWDLVTYFAVVRSHAENKSRNGDVAVREAGKTGRLKNKAGK